MMEEAKGRSDLGICKIHLPKSSILGVDGLGHSNLGHGIVMDPVTPFPDRENQSVSSPSGQLEEAGPASLSKTPAKNIFDPFGLGPEGLMFAPKKKMVRKTCVPIRRQLDFDSCCDLEEHLVDNSQQALEEESFLETAYRSFLDVIVSSKIPLSMEIAVPDAHAHEEKPGIRGDMNGREGADFCDSSSSKVVISGVDDTCPSKTVSETVLGPFTPFLERENLEASSPSDQTDEGNSWSDSQTPRESTFDPFAPGPEGMMFAPKNKLLKETPVSVMRKLNFDSCCDSKEILADDISETSEEESMFLMVHKFLLDAIISCQVGELIGEGLSADPTMPDGIKTPMSLPLINGIAETCPGAPVRPTSKSRKVDVSICRKLEF